MARLNEPVASMENIESLKRKFMRQNRDIARANSTQSLRIRQLENETSRLLAENLGLREQIVRLEGEIDHGRSRRVADRVSVVKSQLEERLLEIGALISGLGEEPPRKRRSASLARQFGGLRSSPLRSPDQRNWKNTVTLSEAVASQEGKLPPILENKQYPRRTLELQDIENLLSEGATGSTDSPDIGPPPVSQFVDPDPVKIDLPNSVDDVEEQEEVLGFDPSISTNLEQRRKRKDSMAASDIKRINRSEASQGTRENAGSLKSGAKRKLSAREDEEPESLRSNDADGFTFTRVSSEDRAKNKTFPSGAKENVRPLKEVTATKGLSKDQPTLPANTRKVLAPKSVNNSPRKSASIRNPSEEAVKPGKADIFKDRTTKEFSKDKSEETAQHIPEAIQPPVDLVKVHLEPETPGAVDIFLPTSARPSTGRPSSRDTPPPPEMGEITEGQRPSRRARGAVSYAEPNLRDKMRRPGKELIDAVTSDGRVRVIKQEEEGGPMTAKTIKAEPESEDAWKRLPSAASADQSPLGNKTSAPMPDVSSNITNHRKRRESILHQAEFEPSTKKSVSELLAESRKARGTPKESPPSDSGLMNALEDMGVYEFRGSPKREIEQLPERRSKQERAPSRFSRRASAMPAGSGAEHNEDNDLRKSTGVVSAPARTASAPTLAPRRRQSTMTSNTRGELPPLASSTRSGSSTSNEAEEPEKSLKRSSSSSSMTGSTASNTRSDRAAVRRRSMMI